MTVPARLIPAASPEQQIASGLHFALANMARALASQVNAVIAAQMKRQATTDTIGHMVNDLLPGLLEKEFTNDLLKNQAAARKRRAVLVHILTAADAQGFAIDPVDTLGNASSAEDGDELTSEEAARLLRVSRTHLNTLLDAGKLGAVRRTEGGHRRVAKAAVLAYKAESQQRQAQGLAAMAEASHRLGLYDEEMAGVPRRRKR